MLVNGEDALTAPGRHLPFDHWGRLEELKLGRITQSRSRLADYAIKGTDIIRPEVIAGIDTLTGMDTALIAALVYPGLEAVEHAVAPPGNYGS